MIGRVARAIKGEMKKKRKGAPIELAFIKSVRQGCCFSIVGDETALKSCSICKDWIWSTHEEKQKKSNGFSPKKDYILLNVWRPFV